MSSPDSHALSKGRRRVIALLLALAVITGFFGVMAVWLNRQALNTTNWTNTSSKLLEDPKIRTALSDYLVNQLFTQVNVPNQLQSVLPPQLKPIAGPVSGALRDVALRQAPELLAQPRVQLAWKEANRAAHKQLLALLNGGGKNLTTTNGDVVLDLRSLLNQLATTVGIDKQIGNALPASAGQLVLLRSDSIKTAQDTAKAVKGLAIVLSLVTFLLWAIALVIAPGMRRIVLRRIGWSFVGIGIAVLLLRRVGGHAVSDGLAQVESAKPVILDAWLIGSSLLYTIAITVVIYGLLLVLAAWLAGATRSASAVRWALAPTLREQPWIAYAALTVVYLLVLVWAPAPAFRNWLPALLIFGLLVLGMEALRRQTMREFPSAQPGDARRAIRTWSSEHLTPGGRANAAEARDSGSRVADLERLSALHARGDLTDEEFATQKGLLIGSV